MQNPTILAIDTATEVCSVALLFNGQVRALQELSPRSHTQRILPMVDQLLSEAGIELGAVNALAFGRGPGSFTGVRVGVGVAQGLAFGAQLPVMPVSNLKTMAQAAYEQEGAREVIALIDARMNEVYCAQFRFDESAQQWQEIVPEQVCAPERAIVQWQTGSSPMVVGTGWAAYPQFAEAIQIGLNVQLSTITLPEAKYMLSLAQRELANGNTQSTMSIEPVYLRNEVTWQKLPRRR